MWEEACRKHDFGYWKGYTKADRKRIDLEWFWAMIEDVDNADRSLLSHGALVYKFVALIYLIFVRAFSGKYFEYGERYKTREDLRIEMEE
jgi:hypothetical protein